MDLKYKKEYKQQKEKNIMTSYIKLRPGQSISKKQSSLTSIKKQNAQNVKRKKTKTGYQ